MSVLGSTPSATEPGAVRRVRADADPAAKGAAGLHAHAYYEDADGFVVDEVWETQEQHDAWFEANVKPNVPVEITQEVIAIHSFQQA